MKSTVSWWKNLPTCWPARKPGFETDITSGRLKQVHTPSTPVRNHPTGQVHKVLDFSHDFEPRQDFDHNNIMNCNIELQRNKSKPIAISCLYRHFSTQNEWYTNLEEHVKQLDFSGFKYIITGDFNLNFNINVNLNFNIK